MQTLFNIATFIDRLNEKIGRATAWLSTILVVLFCADVLLRYVFNLSFAALYELEWHLFAVLFLVAAGYTLQHDKHVRVDVFYAKFSPKNKAWVNLLGTLFFLFPFCFLIFEAGWLYVNLSYQIGESSSDAGGLPARYVVKSFILIGFFLLFLQGISLAIHSLRTILNKS